MILETGPCLWRRPRKWSSKVKVLERHLYEMLIDYSCVLGFSSIHLFKGMFHSPVWRQKYTVRVRWRSSQPGLWGSSQPVLWHSSQPGCFLYRSKIELASSFVFVALMSSGEICRLVQLLHQSLLKATRWGLSFQIDIKNLENYV